MEQAYEDGRPASAIDQVEVAEDDQPDTDDGEYHSVRIVYRTFDLNAGRE